MRPRDKDLRRTTIRMSDTLMAKIRKLATEKHWTLNYTVEYLCWEGVERTQETENEQDRDR